jgi:hypothetical protein
MHVRADGRPFLKRGIPINTVRLFKYIGSPLAFAGHMAETDHDDSIAVHCGRCGKLLIVQIEDIKGKRTIDCEVCENQRPAGNTLPIIRASRVSASANAGSGMAWRHGARTRSWTMLENP